jgi:L,D-transpeptidase YcbB
MARYFWLRITLATAIGLSLGNTFAASNASAESFFLNRSAKPPVTASAVKKKRGLFWFLFEKNNSSNSINNIDSIYGDAPGSSRNFANVDPEPLPSIGMGNLTYEPPMQVPLYDIGLLKLTAPTADGDQIRQILSDKRSRILATVANRRAILAFYKSRQFAPAWVKDGKLTEHAFAALVALAHARDDGLTPSNYLPVGISSFESATSDAVDLDPAALMRLDISLTAETLKFSEHISSGQFVPELLSQYYDINVPAPDAGFMVQTVANTPFPDAYFQNLRPKHPVYDKLRLALAQLDAKSTEENVDRFPTGPLVKPGQRDSRIPDLRTRLVDSGLLDPEDGIVADENRELLDKPLAIAIKAFQKQNKLKATGLLDANLVKVLNADPSIDQRNKLIVNMERMRWLPASLGDRYVFVNQPGFYAQVIDNGVEVWKTKVIVGKPLTQTPAFSDEFETVVFNPSWGLPQSILINEYLGKLRRDPGYFDKIGYKVVNASGQLVASRNVDWYSVGPNSGIGVQQPPGRDNALGELKFLFPNKHDVYMHDTPTRKLFGDTVRAYSHGCVRVENPREFAHVLLGWDPEKIAANIESGESTTTRIPRKTKVHITYFTAWPDDNGAVHFYSDIYERDKTMLEAIDRVATAHSELAGQGLADASMISGSIGNP